MANTKVSITINATDSNQKKTATKIPYVNPQASDDVLKTFAEKCAELSSDTYTGTTKTTEEDITDATNQPTPWVSVDATTIQQKHVSNGFYIIQAGTAQQRLLLQFANPLTGLITDEAFYNGIVVSGYKPIDYSIKTDFSTQSGQPNNYFLAIGRNTEQEHTFVGGNVIKTMAIHLPELGDMPAQTMYVYFMGDESDFEEVG